MNENSSIIHFRQPDEIDDPLTALLRSGARRLLEQAIEAEVEAFLASKKDLKLVDGRDRLVRHGHGPERVIQTGIGPVELQRAPAGQGPRPGCRPGIRAHPVQFGIAAALGATDDQPGRRVADPVAARRLGR